MDALQATRFRMSPAPRPVARHRSRLPSLLPVFLLAQLSADPSPPAVPTTACIGCRSDLPQLRSSYSAEDWQALLRGKVITTRRADAASATGGQSTSEASAIVPYPPAQVWSVVTDFESRPRFVPGLKSVQILRREGKRLWIAEHLRILLINIRFVVVSTVDVEQGSVTWVMDHSAEHDIADTTGSWTVVPLDGGRETLVQYRTWIDSGRSVPRLAEDFLAKRSLPKIVEGIRSEVQRRFPLLRAEPDGHPAE